MISKINELKSNTSLQNVVSLCETTIAAMTSAIYNGVTPEARFEIERVSLENLFEGLSKETDPTIKKWLSDQKRVYSVKNLGVKKAINALKESDGKFNETLNSILENFEYRLETIPEVLLYEEFIASLQSVNWIPSVVVQTNAILEKAKKYKNDVDIAKVIETMKNTRSNYLLPLIEDVVDKYLNDKNEQNKHILKETLIKFSYDANIRDIIQLLIKDAQDLQLEYNNSAVALEKVYSPLMYLGENEVVFNVKGTYYVKKSNVLNKIKKSEEHNLDEQFRNLCECVNMPNVEVDRKSIKVYSGKETAEIFENSVSLNGKSVDNEDFEYSAEVAKYSGNTDFYRLTEALRANFNEITEIDFVKRVHLVENENHAADVFKLRDNIFITTYDPANNKSTFYRNINPIQAEKVMMEHMRFDVSKTFEDILPNKEKILATIAEDKKAYFDFIQKIENEIQEFKNKSFNEEVKAELVSALEEELEEVKSEFKTYLNKVEKYTDIAEGVTVSIDVDGEKYTVPIPQKTTTAKGEEADNSLGTEVGAEHMEDSPASQITFDDDKSELLGDSPSVTDDQVDLGVDNVEAQADAAEAGDEEKEGGDEDLEGDEDLGLGLGGDEEEPTEEPAEEGGEDLDLGLDDEDEDETKKEEGIETKLDPKKNMLTDDIEPEADQTEELPDEEPEATELQQTSFDKPEESTLEEVPTEEVPTEDPDLSEPTDGEVEVKAGEVEVKDENKPKVFLKKKSPVKESFKINLKKNNKLNEEVQLLDTVTLDGKKGYVIGQINGDIIVQIQGNTHLVNPKKVKEQKQEPLQVTPHMKFDKVTQKLLFEQYVRCGIYVGNTPIKVNNCTTRYSEWLEAKDDQPIKVLIEGTPTFLTKDQIRIFEDVNVFANEENFIPGMLIDEATGEGIENILFNVEDLTNAISDTDEIRIIKSVGEEQVTASVPAALVRSLSV
jgi:hypothetical protein